MKTVKVTRLLAVAIAAAVLTTYGCPGPDDSGTSGGGVGAAPTSIAVSPANPGIAIGTTQQFTATGAYSDSTTQDITTTVIWNSSATSVATISSAGLTTATGAGITTIKATSGNVFGATTLTVNPTVNIPKTGQTTSYDANNPKIDDGALQRGVAWPSLRFTTVSGDCVTDNLTGLMWVKTRDGTMRTWQQALDYANNLTLCGYTDWRLPNRKELRSLIDYSQSSPVLPSGHPFGGVTGYWWSSSTYSTDTNIAWAVQMQDGDDTIANKTVIQLAESAWPVRAGQQDTPNPAYPANLPKTGQTTSYATGDDGNLQMGVAWPSLRFTDNGNGTVTDNLTGLMWTQDARSPGPPYPVCATGSFEIAWQNALTHVACLNTNSYLGYSDWRLPNINELQSLVHAGASTYSWLNSNGFTNVQGGIYWSSSTYAVDMVNAWYVVMVSGGVGTANKGGGYYVWPVRAGQ